MAAGGGGGLTNEQVKQQAQYLNMRGAQIAQEQAGQKTELGGQPKAKGTKKQLVGTIVGVIAVVAVLVLLSVLRGL